MVGYSWVGLGGCGLQSGGGGCSARQRSRERGSRERGGGQGDTPLFAGSFLEVYRFAAAACCCL